MVLCCYLGRPRIPSAIMLRLISEIPAAIFHATPEKRTRKTYDGTLTRLCPHFLTLLGKNQYIVSQVYDGVVQ